MRKRIWIPLAVASVAVIAITIAGAYGWRSLHTPLDIPADGVSLDVARGTPLRGVTTELAARGVLATRWPLDVYARATGNATRIRAGEYRIEPGTTPLGLVEQLISGRVFLHQLTIVEGWRFADLLMAVRAHPAITPGTLDGESIMAALGEPGVHPEGQFFPETYTFPKGTTDLDLLRKAHEALTEHLSKAWEARSADVAVRTPYEALILASIIEKETALPSERRLISGVFTQRLRRNMRLETDPTVIYGLGANYDGNLRRRDMESDTPYNTYTRAGLPPTPISLPGGASIEAAVTPEVTNAVFFVATGRGDGSHAFSATLEEHERALAEYLKRLRSDGR